MNKTIKTIAVLLAGLTLTAGTAVAAPHHGRGHRPPPIHHGWHGGYHHRGGYCYQEIRIIRTGGFALSGRRRGRVRPRPVNIG